MKKLGLKLGFMTLLALVTSCDGYMDFTEVDYSALLQEQTKQEFKEAFEAKYGAISPYQSWDFSTMEKQAVQTRAIGTIITEQVPGLNFGITPSVNSNDKANVINTKSVNSDLFSSIAQTLPDGKEQTGNRAVLSAPSTGFLIYPLTCQGGYTYDLYVKVGNNTPFKIFSKTWGKSDQAYVNGAYYGTKDEWVQTGWISGKVQKVVDTSKRCDMPGVYVEAPVGTDIQIYLTNISGNSDKTYKVGTGTGSAILVNCPTVPESISVNSTVTELLKNRLGDDYNIPGSSEIKFVGIEDTYDNKNQKVSGDKDYNDLTLVIVGATKVPVERKIENGAFTKKEEQGKRYMVEDLGTTDDFDFNDIVVDVFYRTEKTYKTTIVNGELTNTELTDSVTYQVARIAHLGGTLDWEFFIDGKSITKGYRSGIMNLDPNEEIKLSDVGAVWNPMTNNVSIKIKQKAKDETTNEWNGDNTILFPERGGIPLMIATDIEKPWMTERENINWGPFANIKK